MLCSLAASGSALERREVSVQETARTWQVSRDATRGWNQLGKSMLSDNWLWKILDLSDCDQTTSLSVTSRTGDTHLLEPQARATPLLLPGQVLRGNRVTHLLHCDMKARNKKCLDTLLPPWSKTHQCESKACLQAELNSLCCTCFNNCSKHHQHQRLCMAYESPIILSGLTTVLTSQHAVSRPAISFQWAVRGTGDASVARRLQCPWGMRTHRLLKPIWKFNWKES